MEKNFRVYSEPDYCTVKYDNADSDADVVVEALMVQEDVMMAQEHAVVV
jgi:hypothetical protein